MNPNNPQLNHLLEQGYALHQQGQIIQAKEIYEKILQVDPKHFDALHLLAIICNTTMHYDEAIELMNDAILINPNHPPALLTQGNLFKSVSQFNLALVSYEKAILLKPDFSEAHYNKGTILQALNQLDLAIQSYCNAISLTPHFVQAYFNCGVIYQEQGKWDLSIENYQLAIRYQPTYAQAHNNLGNAFHKNNSPHEALVHYRLAIEYQPNFSEAYFNQAVLFQELNSSNEAIESYQNAIIYNPSYAQAYNNLGLLFLEKKDFSQAILNLNLAIQYKSDYAEAFNNVGNAYRELGNIDQALYHYELAIANNKDYGDAIYNRGLIFQDLKKFDLAIADFKQVVNLKLNLDYLPSIIMHAKMLMCDWNDFTNSLQLLINNTRLKEKVLQPFPSLGLVDSLELQSLCSEIFTTSHYQPNYLLGEPQPAPRKDKIRIGYFSADFGNHPISFLTTELFELHDRNHFEVFAFSLKEHPEGEMLSRLQQGVDKFVRVNELASIDIAKLSRDLHIDIAIDLGGFTSNHRADVFTYRPAPIQLSYLGFLGTMGPHFMDYIIADQTIIPQESQHFYSEKIIYLPSYQVNDSKRKISDRAFSRNELGLPETGFVFCCFNNNFKITPNTFDGWMRILHAVHDSVLFLYAENPWAESNLKLEAQKRGILPTRLIFGQRLARDEYLARYQVCDLFLDTLPYNAGTTASDALWAGLPVLTLMGESFASRVAASLLQAIHLPELITTSQSDYEALAIHIGNHPQLLLELKKKLGNNRLTTPLFNTAQFTKSLESAYTQIINNHCKQKPLDHVVISF